MDRLLLDTHALLWWMMDAPELPKTVRKLVASTSTEVFVSAASVWEIAIKARKGRLFGVDDYLREHARWHAEWVFAPAPITADDAARAGTYTFAHADPFDRMLIAQSERLDASLLTCDEAITAVCARAVWGSRKLRPRIE